MEVLMFVFQTYLMVLTFDTWDVTHTNSNKALLGQSPKNLESKLFKKRGKPLNGWSQDDKLRTKQFQDWCSTWLGEVYRVLKPCSPILIMCGRQNQHRFTCASGGCWVYSKRCYYLE